VSNTSLPDFSRSRVLVAGDVMADVYWIGAASRISPEAPVPVVRIDAEEMRLGGAANVALNIAALGATATLVGLVGDDATATELEKQLEISGIERTLRRVPGTPTIRKLRVLSRRQQLVRLDFERDFHRVDAELKKSLILENLGHSDVVVLSDYAKGFFGPETAAMIRLARDRRQPVLVDPKGTDFMRYSGATLITPNLAEFEAIVGECSSDSIMIERGHNLRAQLSLEALLITRGERGMTLLEGNAAPLHLPSRAREVYDVTGAGDTVVATLAAAIGAGTPLRQAVEWANVAAGLVVGKSGTATVSVAEIRSARDGNPSANTARKVVARQSLAEIVSSAKASGKTVVMTNGCFDVLHAGHVDILRRARELGDLLIVAVNDDESVRRLKGSTRPVNSLAHRLTVLAMLECVDCLTVFSENTPEALYRDTLPSLLVKGGDYSADAVAGAAPVIAAGGRVAILDLVEGLSTTEILAKLHSPAK